MMEEGPDAVVNGQVGKSSAVTMMVVLLVVVVVGRSLRAAK
jgi:hypothetical protein